MAHQDKPTISTIVLNWNRSDLLQITLDSYSHTTSIPHELIILDNASTDNSREIIESFCRDHPKTQAIFLPSNEGGEAINIGLDKCNGTYIHISENDIEYLKGWDQKALDLFEAFPDLGQLSLFGPIPTDQEVWEDKTCHLTYSQGMFVYKAKHNVGTTSILRREIFDKGIRIENTVSNTKILYPDDGLLSKQIKKAGYLVAWAPFYFVINRGHLIGEFEDRLDYYKETYQFYVNIQREDFLSPEIIKEKILKWRQTPKPSRNSFLIPDETISPELTPPDNECPTPRIWSMLDARTPEIETLEFLYSIVRLLKPRLVIQTRDWRGYAATAIGKALMDNDLGKLISIEPESDFHKMSQSKISDFNLEDRIKLIHGDSQSFSPEEKINLLILDSESQKLISEFRHFQPQLNPGAIVILKSTKSYQKAVNNLIKKEPLTSISIPTPRGFMICQYYDPTTVKKRSFLSILKRQT